MPDGYTVVPDSLRAMATELRDAGTEWTTMCGDVQRLLMTPLTLGALGEAANYPTAYNDILYGIVEQLLKGTTSLTDTASTVAQVARYYSDKDADYYEEFGYLESEMD
jgi:hypothetical protein